MLVITVSPIADAEFIFRKNEHCPDISGDGTDRLASFLLVLYSDRRSSC